MGEKLKTKELILAIATEVFHNKGYTGARMQEIADLAKVNKAALHYYFSSKQQLFEVILLNSFKNLFISFENLAVKELPIFDKIDFLIDEYSAFVKKNIQIIKFILSEVDKNLPLIQTNIKMISLENSFIGKMYNEFDREMKLGNIKTTNPRHLLTNIISMCIFPFIAKPVIMEINKFSTDEINAFLDEREKYIKQFVHNALKI